MAKTALAVILHLEHVNATTGADSQWFDASTGGYSGLSPRSVQYVPCIDGASVSPFREQVVDGRTVKEPTPPADVSLTLLRYVNGIDRLSALIGRNILGRSATVGYVGTAADGTVYTPAAPFVIAQGQVIPPFKVAPDKWTITVRPQNALYQREVPSRALLGYRTGVLGNGDGAATTVIVATGYSTISAATTLVALVLVPRLWDIGASDTHAIWANKGLFFGAKRHTDGYSWRLFCRYSTTTGGTLEEIPGPVIEPDETLRLLSCRFTAATKTAVFGVDTTFSTAVGSAAFVALSAAEDWQMMRFRTDATSVSGTLMGAFMLFTSVLTDGEVAALAAARARGDEATLKLYYRETDGAGTYLDEAAANAASPIDATITAGTETSLFEGPLELAGVKPPLILQGQHMPLVPVDHARLIYRASKHPIENASRVMDGGNNFTITHRYSVKDLVTNAPGAGEVAMTPDMGGLFRFNSLTDGAELAADIQGSSGWPMSLALGTDHGFSEVDLGTSLGPDLVSTGGYALEIWFETGAELPSSSGVIWSSGFITVAMSYVFNKAPYLFVRVEGTSGDITFDLDPIPVLTVVSLRIEAWNNGSDMASRVLLNGVVVDAATAAGTNLTNVVAVPPKKAILADNASIPVLGFPHVGALPLRAWSLVSPTSRTNAVAEAETRKFLFRHPVNGVDAEWSDLVGLWYRFTTDINQVDDETGNGYHGTVVNGGTFGRWRPGLCWSDPLHAPAYLLQEHGGYDLATQLTIADLAYAYLEPAAQDLWFPPETKMSKALAMAAGPGFVFLRADGTAVLGLVVDATAGNSQGTVAGVLEVGEKTVAAGEGKGMPPSLVVAEYARIGATGQTALAATDSERRALMSAEVREDAIPIGANATIYGDLPFPDGVRLYSLARFRDAGPTRRELQRLASIWADPRPMYEVRLEGAGRTLQVGDIWAVTDPLGGATAYVLVMARVTGTESETLEVR